MNSSSIGNQIQKSLVAAACLATFGCGDDPVSIGDGDQSIDKNSLGAYAATWDGYVEAHTFRSGSDRVRVMIDASGAGFLQVGEGGALPLPTDPDVGWPAEAGLEGSVYEELYDGVRYPLGNMRIESERIRFQIETRAAFAPFCELQTPVAVDGESGVFGCFPFTGYARLADGCGAILAPGTDFVLVDCSKVFICLDGCSCDATSCTGGSGLEVPLDAALDDSGDELVGTIILQDENVGLRNIRLQRQ